MSAADTGRPSTGRDGHAPEGDVATRVRLGVSGHSHVDPRLAGLPASRPRRHAFPAGWALIEHPTQGAILFDCGYGQPARTAMQRGLRRVYRHVLGTCCPPEGDAASLLRARGIPPEGVAWIVVSHFHPDHVGGLREFPNARFVAHRDAWDSVARGPLSRLHAQIWRELLPDDFAARVRVLQARDFLPLHGDLEPLGAGVDLFGDGALIALALPGHAAGQIGLALRDGGDRVVLVADAFWQSAQVEAPVALSWLTRRLAMHSAREYAGTLDRLRRFRALQPDAWIIASHCSRTLADWEARHPGAVLRAPDLPAA